MSRARDSAGENPPVSKPLGQRLVEAGLLTESQLDLALREQRRSKGLLGKILIALGFVSEEDITAVLADENNVEVVRIQNLEIASDILELVSYETAKLCKAIPLEQSDGVLTVAFADAMDIVAQDAIERESNRLTLVVTAPEAQILEAIERNYNRASSINETIDQVLTGDSLAVDEDDAPMVRLVDQLVSMSIKLKATDIHLQPEERNLRLRLRVDGMLREEVTIPKALQSPVLARLKLMAGMDVTEKRVPQDGRIRFKFGSSRFDLRASTLPTNHGESMVMRVLDGGATQQTLTDLGLSANDLERLNSAIAHPYGMVIVCGPTGSGKTTTLYTALGSIDRESRSVFTLEDPIEYTLPLIRQTQVHAEIGMDFAAGLKALLRQDPDVILVGEIRDTETAELSVRAALTGHLVFSTLHTNSAIGVIPRLVDMGIERYLLPSALVCMVGQRLLRKLCPDCCVQATGADPLLEASELKHLRVGDSHWQAVGCDTCSGKGFLGRIAVYEVLLIDHTFHDAIISGSTESQLLELARNNGMTTMLEDGVQKAAAGLTTVAEVLRVVR